MNKRIPHLGLLGALAVAVTLAGCATPRMGSVIPREGGQYQVISIGESEKAALESALYSAESTCKGRAMRHVVIDHRTEYRGLGTETAAQTIEKVGRIILGTTGQRAPQIAGEDDYRVTMQFRCEDARR
ncbi:hypothetical protein [Caldimonas tepidiphila]|uniref:hypothetical protein n=1 Tax=Caldimonas tepidiphila TaxID=2315841 RepID=UPI000E5B541B|nr:hypothetical protein [Caldimonas tepidiphila]